MKEEKLFETIADINENYVADAHKKPNKKRANSWMKWVAVAACLCLVIIGAIAIPKMKTPEQTAGGGENGGFASSSVASATTTLYNGKTYVALVLNDELVSIGLPENITEEMIGEHVTYLNLSGEVADYIETDEETDIELFTCTIDTSKEVFILRDGETYWAIVEVEKEGTAPADVDLE